MIHRNVARIGKQSGMQVTWWLLTYFPDAVGRRLKSGSRSTALASSSRYACLYVLIVRLMSLCRMIDWATFGLAPPPARKLPVAWRNAWRSA